MIRAGAVDMTDTPYLAIEWSASVPVYISLALASDRIGIPEVYRDMLGANAVSYFRLDAIDAAGFRFAHVNGPVEGATMTFSVHKVSRVSTLPDADTAGHQQTLALPPGGSARTQGEIVVETDTVGLGEVTLYTAPLGSAYSPSLRQPLVSSDAVISVPDGDYQTITGASIYDVPVSTLPPGGYV